MSFFRWLFGQGDSRNADNRPDSDDKDIADHLDYLNSLRVPAVRLTKSEHRQFSKIGGLPNMPETMTWPEWKGKPLDFLCQLDLSRIPQEYTGLDVPRCGALYFFYDQDQSTWGFDPKDKGSWRVLYTPVVVADWPERKVPPGGGTYPEKPIGFSLVQTYPDWQDDQIGSRELTLEEEDEYTKLRESVFAGQPSHHLFGYPSVIQNNDMDLECQLASGGLLARNRSDWTLLLQLDTDDDAGMMWGDCGMLYFWIRKDDLKAGHFDDCWMILQCS